MASSTGVKSQDLGKADTRQLNPSTIDFISPLGKGSAITQDMNKVLNIDTALEVIDSKPDAAGEIVDITGCKLSSNDKECLAAEILDDPMDDDGVDPMDILPYSSHRDGSIYGSIGSRWKRSFCIADRSESK